MNNLVDLKIIYVSKNNCSTKKITKGKIMGKNKDNKDLFIESLKANDTAEAYFNATLEDCKNLTKEEAEKHLVKAFKNIAVANGKLGEWVTSTNLGENMMASVAKLIYKSKIQ